MDLDGTLFKTDTLHELIISILKKSPLIIFKFPFWLFSGKAYFKKRVSNHVEVNFNMLPQNKEFVNFLSKEKENGRQLILATGSSEKIAKQAFNFFAIFDKFISSDDQTNLTGKNKLERIIQENGSKLSFSYAGNSKQDLTIWEKSEEVILVNYTKSTADRVDSYGKKILKFSLSSPLNFLCRSFRIHQWIKNTLIFVPLIVSHRFLEIELLFQSFFGFFSFCLCASSGYLINDLLDLNADRSHVSKSKRPLASGDLPLSWGIISIPSLFLGGMLIAIYQSPSLFMVVGFYYISSFSYSLFFKKIIGLDIAILAILYTIRIYAGSLCTGIEISSWLLCFSLSLFCSLALLKRFTELNALSKKDRILRRSYSPQHMKTILLLGLFSIIGSVSVLISYILSADARSLYQNWFILWLIVPLFCYSISRMWFFAHQNKMDQDPVAFAINDRTTVISVLLSTVILICAK